jgi:hypothetical protein
VGVLVPGNDKQSSVGAPRLDPPERIQALLDLHYEHPTLKPRQVANLYLDNHPEVVEESRGNRESVARRLADRLAEAEGEDRKPSKRELFDRLQLHLIAAVLITEQLRE